MANYGLEFLKDKGFFGEKVEIEDDYSPGESIEYIFDPENKVAYFENNFEREEISKIVKGLKKQRNFDYYWFWEDGRVAVFRTFGENKQFSYNLEHSLGSEWKKGKKQKLENLTTENIDVLFEMKEVINHFYKKLWDIRIELAEAIQNDLPEKDKIMSAQRFIDRLIFIYFLGEKGIIKGKDKAGNEIEVDAKGLFRDLLGRSNDFLKTITRIFFDYLNNSKKEDLPIEGSKGFSLHIPYLNGGLFREKNLETSKGTIKESEIEIEGFEWSKLIEELNNYNWILDDYQTREEKDVVGNLTPEVLGHIYEKFVISISKSGQINDLEDLKTTEKGELKKGNKKIGAYYTPEEITAYIAKNTLFPFLKEETEISAYESFRDFYKENKDNSEKLAQVDEALSKVKILDPAVGSGHFLMAIADVISNWRRKCNEKISEYSLRKNTIINNLYGVDIMDGAVEICKLRLWLWLISSQKREIEPEPLPNIDFNIRSGNSLIGFAKKEIKIDQQKLLITANLKDSLEKYSNKIDKYKIEAKNAEEKKQGLEELHESMQKKLNKWYANTLDLKIEEDVEGPDEALNVVKCSGQRAYKLKLKFQSSMSDNLKENLSELGFRTWKKSANLKLNQQSASTKIKKSFNAIANAELGRSFIERQVERKDLENIKPFHWIMEFPKVWEKNGFEIIVGNPPHGNILEDIEKDIISSKYPWGTMNTDNNLKGSNNAGTIFTERCYGFECSPNRLGFVLPSSVARVEEFEKFRSYVRDKVERIGEIGIAFKDVGLEQIVAIFHEEMTRDKIKVFEYRDKTFQESKIPKKLYEDRDIFLTRLDEKKHKALVRIEEGTTKLLDLVPDDYEMPRGITVKASNYSDKPAKGEIQVLGGTNLFPYGLKSGEKRKSSRYLNKDHSKLKDYKSKFPKRRVVYQNVVSSNPHVVSTYLPFQLPTDDTLNNLVLKDGPAKPLVTILNSKLITFYLNYGIINCSRLTVHLDSPYMGKIPVPEFDEDVFSKLTDVLLFLQQVSKGDAWSSTDKDKHYEDLFTFFNRLANLAVYETYLGREIELDKSLGNILTNYLETINYVKYMELVFASRKKDNSEKALEDLKVETFDKINSMKNILSEKEDIGKIEDTLLDDEVISLIEAET